MIICALRLLWCCCSRHIDGDGKPDLFADLKMFETPGKWALYLSSAAGAGELVEKVAEFAAVDC